MKSAVCLESTPGSLTRKETLALESTKSGTFGNALSTGGLAVKPSHLICDPFINLLTKKLIELVRQAIWWPLHRSVARPWTFACGLPCVWSSYCQNEGCQFSSRFTKHMICLAFLKISTSQIDNGKMKGSNRRQIRSTAFASNTCRLPVLPNSVQLNMRSLNFPDRQRKDERFK